MRRNRRRDRRRLFKRIRSFWSRMKRRLRRKWGSSCKEILMNSS